jgi:hypothetical protein
MQRPGLHHVVGRWEWRWWMVDCRSGPKYALLGSAQEA